MNLASPRSLFFLAFLACAAMLGAGFYLQYVVGLEPCPLCIVQRIFFAGAGLFSLIAALHGRGRRVYSVLVLLCSLGGAGTAGRLPTPSNNVVGRTGEVAQLSELLNSSRLVTVIGVGGVGKTSVSVNLATALADRHS